MNDPELEAQERLRLRIEGMIAQVMQADEAAIGKAVQLARKRQLVDDHTAAFLLMSRRLLLATTVGLSSAIELHRLRLPGPDAPAACEACGSEGRCRTLRRIADTLAVYLPAQVTLTRAEAWRRADAQFNAYAPGADHLVGVHEIPDAFVAWASPARYPAQQHQPTLPGVVIVDKRTGLLTTWPALPLPILADRYHRYVLGLPPDSDDYNP